MIGVENSEEGQIVDYDQMIRIIVQYIINVVGESAFANLQKMDINISNVPYMDLLIALQEL